MKRPRPQLKYKNCKNKPKRPLSAYNIFYRFSREHIISSLSCHQDAEISFLFDEIISMDNDSILKSLTKIIKGYRFGSDYSKSTLHGRIGFQDLTRIMAKQWANLNPSKRSLFEMSAKADKQIYVEKRNLWRIEKDRNIKRKLEEQVISGKVTHMNPNHHLFHYPNKNLKNTYRSDCVFSCPPKDSHRRVVSEETYHSIDSNSPSSSYNIDENTNCKKILFEKIKPIFDSDEESSLTIGLKVLGNTSTCVSNQCINSNCACHSVIEPPLHFDLSFKEKNKYLRLQTLRRTLLEEIFDCDSDLDLFFSTLI